MSVYEGPIAVFDLCGDDVRTDLSEDGSEKVRTRRTREGISAHVHGSCVEDPLPFDCVGLVVGVCDRDGEGQGSSVVFGACLRERRNIA